MVRRAIQTLLVVMLALLPFGASAQSSITSSTFQVQNLSENDSAAITVIYYDSAGTQVATQSESILPGASMVFYNGENGTKAMAAPAGFRGSVVISSSMPIAAISNLQGATIGESYSGFSAGSSSVGVPLLMRNNSGFSTVLTVQNTGSTSTTVTVTYTPSISGNTGVTETADIAAYSSKAFDQGANANLGTTFIGSAIVTAANSGSIVGIVNQTAGKQLLTYNAFTGGASSIALPLLQANNANFYTSIQVQNTGTADTTVTIKFAPNAIANDTTSNPAPCATPADKTFPLAKGAQKVLIQAVGLKSDGTPDTSEPFDATFQTCRYVGGATITSTGDQALAAIVNQQNKVTSQSSSYESLSVTSATSKIQVPSLQANNSGINSSVLVQNVASADAQVTITYGANSATGANACGKPIARTITLKGNSSFVFQQASNDPNEGLNQAGGGTDGQFATCTYIGSATVTAGVTDKIVAVVNLLAPSSVFADDGLFSYNAFSVVP